ncbi:MAG: glycosyltransferase family 2 protein [Pseudodesulfovibrio sp.]
MDKPTANVGIVLVHYGEVSATLRCIDSLSAMASAPKVVVVNHDAYEYTRVLGERLAMRGLEGRVRQQGNKGFAAGCNTGIRIALALGAEYIWLLNNDTVVEPSALKELMACAEKNPKSIIGATVLDFEFPGTIQVAAGFRYHPFLSVIQALHRGRPVGEIPSLSAEQLDYVYGASLFLPASIYNRVGPFDENFFLYYEELDFCIRARRIGATLLWCRDCKVRHVGGGAVQTAAASTASYGLAAYHEARSTLLFTRKHYPAALPAVLFLRLFAKPILLLFRGKWRQLGAANKGLLSGLIDAPGRNNQCD